MNKIVWNQVTWYSKLLAVIVFVLVFWGAFSLGKQAGEIDSIIIPVTAPASISTPINTVSYKCDGGKTINAKFYEGVAKAPAKPNQMPVPTGSVALKLSDGRSMNLPQTISADGGRYADKIEEFIFWSKGNGAFFEEGVSTHTPTYENCVVASQTLKN